MIMGCPHAKIRGGNVLMSNGNSTIDRDKETEVTPVVRDNLIPDFHWQEFVRCHEDVLAETRIVLPAGAGVPA